MQLSREQWLTEISDLMLADLFLPVGLTIRSDLKLKLSVGFPPGVRANSRVVACCFPSSASSEGYSEIFISPVIDDSLEVLTCLVHEICHAIDDNKGGHKGMFAMLAQGVGLMRPFASAHASPELNEFLQSYIDMFGDIPHASIDYTARKQQSNRQLKVWCECGFKFNTSRLQIEKCVSIHGGIMCPCCTNFMKFDI